MAKTYVPTQVIEVHELAKFMVRYNATIRAAITALDPTALEAYDALYTAVVAFDAFREILYPLGD